MRPFQLRVNSLLFHDCLLFPHLLRSVLCQLGKGDTKTDVGIGVFVVKVNAALQRLHRFFNASEFAQTDAVVVGYLGVIQHAVQRFKNRQGVVQIAMLQQAQHVLLRLDAVFGNRDHPDELVIHGDDGIPALVRVFERVAGYHRLIKIRGVARRQPGQVNRCDWLLKNFRCAGGGVHFTVQSWARDSTVKYPTISIMNKESYLRSVESLRKVSKRDVSDELMPRHGLLTTRE